MTICWKAAQAAVLWLLIGFGAAAAEPRDSRDPGLVASIDRQMAEIVGRHQAAGAAVAVVHNGRIVLLKGYGLEQLKPRRPVDPAASLFGLASTTKVFTWIALMQAVEAGRIDLAKPVNTYLPDDLKVADHAGWRQVSGVDLMRHTEGFEDGDLRIAYVCGAAADPLRDYLRRYRVKRTRPPGDTPSYSNYGVNIAALMALQASGDRDAPSLFERRIFQPLGMTSTTLRNRCRPARGAPAAMAPALAARRTPFAYWDGERFQQAPDEAMPDAPASDVSTTAQDMATFMLAFLGDDAAAQARILSPSSIKAFRTALLGGGQSNGWAHGFEMFALPDGGTGYGHDGGTYSTSATLVMEPKQDLGIFAVANNQAAGPALYALAQTAIREGLAPAAFGPHRLRPPDPALARRAANLSGEYLTTRRAFGGLAWPRGWSPTTVSVSPEGYLLTGAEGIDRRWTTTAERGVFVDVEGEERIAFKFDESDRALSWRPPSAARTYERLGPLDGEPVFLSCLVAGVLASIVVLVSAAVRRLRPNASAARPKAVKRFDGAQVLAAVLVLAWVGLAVTTAAITSAPGPHPSFPPPTLLTAAAAAIIAAILTLGLLVALPRVWASGVSRWRVLFRSLCLFASAACLLRLATLGALFPWA